MSDLSVKVARKLAEATDIVSLEFVSADSSSLPPFSAGSHIDVHLPNGLIRQYSLCNDPAEAHRYMIAVLRDPASRGGSVAVHELLNEGDTLKISAPRNHFPLVNAKRSLLFAGGIGVTPILCMAERLSKTGAQFEMHYCARSPDRAAFLERIASSGFAESLHLHYDDGASEQKLNLPALLAQPDADTHIYVCGPGGFIDYVVNTAKAHGWPVQQVHLEYFGAVAQDTSSDQVFEVQVASTGKCYPVPIDKSVVQVLADNGIDVSVSCEQGVCGTCITRVLNGEPDHRDLYFTDAEKAKNDQFTPCCSRSKSKTLVLDL